MEEKSKISVIEGSVLVFLAAVVDLLQLFVSFLSLIPVTPFLGLILNKIVAVIAYIFFALWFVIRGLGVIRLTGGFFGELLPIPFLSALPFWTGMILWEVIKDRKIGKVLKVTTGKVGKTKQIKRSLQREQKVDYREARSEALNERRGRDRALELGRLKKQESGELQGRALYEKGTQKELGEKQRIVKDASKRVERKARAGWDPDTMAKEERERQKIETKKDRI